MVFFCGLWAPQVLKVNRVHIVSSFVINKKKEIEGMGLVSGRRRRRMS